MPFEDQEEQPPLCCPQCASPLIDRVAREGIRDYFWFLFGRYPFRCRLCGREFYLPHRDIEDQRS